MKALQYRLRRVPGVLRCYRFVKQARFNVTGYRARKLARVRHGGMKVSAPAYRNTFCGYYDHSPFNPNDESRILAHANRWPAWRTPSSAISTDIVILDWRTQQVVNKLGETTAWNWQQGARALWLSGDAAVFNVYDPAADAYRARIVTGDGVEQSTVPIPVQEWDGRGRIYGIRYEALCHIRPDYGYRNRQPTQAEIMENRIERYDLNTGTMTSFVGVPELVGEARDRHGEQIRNPKLNHLMASPDGQQLIFLFRYFVGERRITDLYALDAANGHWRCVLDNHGVSHYCWLDSATALATLNGPDGFGYYSVDVISSSLTLVRRAPDGHPQPLNNRWFLTDTYPDRYGLRRLLAASFDKPDETKRLGEFPEPLLLQGETRCDLHPSVSSSGRWIQVDMTDGHRRCVGVLSNPFA